jgi:hypothetical protein
MMSFSLYKSIIDKIKREYGQCEDKPTIYLYNWGECFLHPQLDEFVRYGLENNFDIGLSTNLNIDVDLKKIVNAKPTWLRISFSGFYQPTYEKGHRKGNINIVKSNLYKLRYYMDSAGVDFPVQMLYHVYRDNMGDEFSSSFNLARELKFGFLIGWAYFMPLEKVMGYLSGKVLTNDEQQLLQRLLLPIETQVEIGKSIVLSDCPLRMIQTVINHDGTVQLCCAVYDPKYTISDSFLDNTQDELQVLKYAHPFCKGCMAQNLPAVMLAAPGEEWDRLSNIELGKLNIPYVLTAGKRLC